MNLSLMYRVLDSKQVNSRARIGHIKRFQYLGATDAIGSVNINVKKTYHGDVAFPIIIISSRLPYRKTSLKVECTAINSTPEMIKLIK